MKKTTKHLCQSKHLRYKKQLLYGKHFRSTISVLTISLLWFFPLELLAQRPSPGNNSASGIPAKSPSGNLSGNGQATPKKDNHNKDSHNVYPSSDQVPAAASTYITDKVLEPARNHSYDFAASDLAGYDTVFVSTEMTTYLIFPSPIRLLDLGSKNYAGRIEQNKLLLKPVRGYVSLSAMMIETEDGQIYLHYIGYKQQPKRIFWDYRPNLAAQANGNLGSGDSGNHKAASYNAGSGNNGNGNNQSGNKADQIYTGKLAYLKKQKRRKLFYEKQNNIAIRICGLAVDNTATYMLLEIDNHSSIPYKLEYVSFAYQEKRKRKTRRKVVGEENQVLPMLAQTTDMVKPHSTSELAYAFPLFANTLKGKLQIIVRETDGNRVIRAFVPAKVLAKTLYIPNAATGLTLQK